MPRGHRRGNRKKGEANFAATVERAERTAIFGKTKMCKFFILGVCAKGKECCFAHDPSEMNPAPDLSRTKICKTLINTGYCDDPNCKYAHNKEELRAVPAGESADSTSSPGQLDPGSQVSESSPGQPTHAQAQQAGWKPGQQMSPELMQQLASNVAVQMKMLQMAMQTNPSRPDPSTCPALPLAALTQQGAFVRQNSSQSDSSVNSMPGAAAQPGGVQHADLGISGQEDGAMRQSASGFRPRAAVTLADALGTRISNTPAPSTDEERGPVGAEQVPPQFWQNKNAFDQREYATYTNGSVSCSTGRAPMPQETSFPGSLPNEHFQSQQEILINNGESRGQFPFPGAGANLVVKNTFYDEQQPPVIPAIHHSSTWAGNLNAVASQEKLLTEWDDSVGLFDGAQDFHRQASDASTVSSLGPLPMCEKRMQDTPIFAAGGMMAHAADQDLHTVYEGDMALNGGYPGGNNAGLDESLSERQNALAEMPDMDCVTVKNTFLEFAPAQPFVGIRAVRTAAGRLDSWGQE